MNVKTPLISSLIDQIQQDSCKVSMTKQIQIQVNKTINELYVLAVIYSKCNPNNKQIIDKQLLHLQKQIIQNRKSSSGFFSRLANWNNSNIVSLKPLWKTVVQIQQNEIAQLLLNLKSIKFV